MDLSLFDYDLPASSIAQAKSEPRDSSRLFHIDLGNGQERREHLRFSDLPSIITEGDILVVNRSKVIPARIHAHKPSGGKAELLLLEETKEGWEALVGGKGMRAGMSLRTDDERTRILLERNISQGRYLIGFEGDAASDLKGWLMVHGRMPTPPYIKGDLKDPGTYQTVYAREDGSVAAPTAGLHFTDSLMADLKEKGILIAEIILHVGYGTFAPVRTERVEDHMMEAERFWIPPATIKLLEEACDDAARGRYRIWPVGTTSMRTLETAFDPEGRCVSPEGRSSLFITPGYRFKIPYKGFITNFHLPKSTPLLLLSAFWDRKRVLDAYEEAKRMEYRFYSLGDSMAIRRRH
jgi:S-adenosylmethionine:tRNA ribosyltransferase-isomerase